VRNISFSMTKQQFLDGTKTVTRRMGWLYLKPGTELMAVEKAMGIKKGEKVSTLGKIRVLAVRRERLDKICGDMLYGRNEVMREGFPDMDPIDFMKFFCSSHVGCKPESVVTRIEFERIQ
jgi:hypothetical protein